jgi:hypothetical protein
MKHLVNGEEGSTHEAQAHGSHLAKNLFQVHGVDQREKLVWRKRPSRKQWLRAVMDVAEPGCEVGRRPAPERTTEPGNCRHAPIARKSWRRNT